jgi:2-succinyl-6-hydroxy-2,4-cyclohexadiene-1-carboxylate synthase
VLHLVETGLRGPNAQAGLRGPNAQAGLRGPNAGAGAGRRVVLVHGFTQTLRSWDPLAARLARRRSVARVDLPGHGGSAGVRLDFVETTAALGAVGGEGAYVGYSLGGRLCLRLALDRPELVTALVLLGASPGLADPGERAARRQEDDALAATIERDGTAAFLRRWLASPLFAGLRPAPADLAARRANPAAGLAAALRLLGTGVQEPLWDRLGDLRCPVLLLAGADDAKFATIAERMAEHIGPRADVALIAGAGHAAHLERPDEVAVAIEGFLDEHQEPAPRSGTEP